MSRMIKFRGLTNYGKWVFGGTYDDYIVRDSEDIDLSCVLLIDRITSVIPKTIGQYIGFKDKNGKDIYEGDIDSSGYVVTYLANLGDGLGMKR